MRQEQPPQGVDKYLGADVISSDGKKVGALDRFVPSRLTGVQEWMILETGLFGSKQLVVPVAGSAFDDSGVHVPYSSQIILDEPEIETAEDLTAEAESTLNAYFGLGAA